MQDGFLVIDAQGRHAFVGGTPRVVAWLAGSPLLLADRQGVRPLRGLAEGDSPTWPRDRIMVIGGVRLSVHAASRAADGRIVATLGKRMVSASPKMFRVFHRVAAMADHDAPVLILGESGTGKELVARAIHDHSDRQAGPFVVVDCGALAPTLVASELFGHEKGAFTGAERTHIGAFERAQGGTLFLDEVGELSAELQPQLLGALERRQFRRVGGKADIPLDVRVVTATNRDLRAEVNAGTFRMDVYFRIAVVVLKIPPLRERRTDLPLLVEHFVRQAGHDGPLEEILPTGALAELDRHQWPGNVRELRNWVEATLALGESPELFASGPDAAADGRTDAIGCEPALLELPYKDARELLLRRFEERYLERLIERAGDNVTRAARLARMDRSYLIRLLQRHQKRDGRDGPADELGEAEPEA